MEFPTAPSSVLVNLLEWLPEGSKTLTYIYYLHLPVYYNGYYKE